MQNVTKAPFRSYKSTDDRDWPICCSLLDAESTGFGSKRLRCSIQALFQSNMVEQAVTCSCIHQSPGHRGLQGTTYSLLGYIPVTRAELELNLGVKVVACWRGDQVTGVRMST